MAMMACVDPGVMEQEQTFQEYLQNAQTFVRSEGLDCRVAKNAPRKVRPEIVTDCSRNPHDDKQWKSADVYGAGIGKTLVN